jgi:hypothetical protein
MLPALLAGIGLPLLTRVVRGGLKAVGNPVADAAADALDKVDETVARGEIPPERIAEANRHLERISAIEAERETEILTQVNRTMRAESGSDDAYVRRWRPTFGYIVSLTWALQFAAIAYAMVATPEYAHELVQAIVALTPAWGIALAVLGVNVVKRSRDKEVAAGLSEAAKPGLLDRLLGR